MENNINTEIKRVNGYLKEVVTFFDNSGKPISHIVNPIMVELKPRDMAQIFVGSLLVASPLCLTEEVWNLSESLPQQNVSMLFWVSLITVSTFVYFNFYRFKLKGNVINFIKRIVATYFISIMSVVLILFLINKLPIQGDLTVAINRVILIGFPTIFGGTITDYLK